MMADVSMTTAFTWAIRARRRAHPPLLCRTPACGPSRPGSHRRWREARQAFAVGQDASRARAAPRPRHPVPPWLQGQPPFRRVVSRRAQGLRVLPPFGISDPHGTYNRWPLPVSSRFRGLSGRDLDRFGLDWCGVRRKNQRPMRTTDRLGGARGRGSYSRSSPMTAASRTSTSVRSVRETSSSAWPTWGSTRCRRRPLASVKVDIDMGIAPESLVSFRAPVRGAPPDVCSAGRASLWFRSRRPMDR